MPHDLRQLLERAAPEQVGTLDTHALVERAMRQRTILRVVVAASVIVAAVVGGSLLVDTPSPVEIVEQPSEIPTAPESDRQTSAILEFDPGPSAAAEVAEVLDLRVAALGLDASTWVEGTRVIVGIHDQAPADLVASALLQPSLISVRPILEDPAATEPGCEPQVAPVDERAVLCGTFEPSPWTASFEDLTGYVVGPGFWITQPVGVEVVPGPSAGLGPTADVILTLSDQDEGRFTALTSDAACERDRGGAGQIAVVLGPFVHTVPGMDASVACGSGITGGVMLVQASSEAQAEALALALTRPLPPDTTLVTLFPPLLEEHNEFSVSVTTDRELYVRSETVAFTVEICNRGPATTTEGGGGSDIPFSYQILDEQDEVVADDSHEAHTAERRIVPWSEAQCRTASASWDQRYWNRAEDRPSEPGPPEIVGTPQQGDLVPSGAYRIRIDSSQGTATSDPFELQQSD